MYIYRVAWLILNEFPIYLNLVEETVLNLRSRF